MIEPLALESAFRRIAATRMAGMALANPTLEVEAVGFRDWDGRQVGVLVTPWAINLVLLPGQHAPVPALAPNQRGHWRFPSGEYEFMGGSEPECGAFQFCSLLSPPDGFDDQAQAREFAVAVIHQLFVAPSVSRRALLRPPAARA
jgi:[NiFe] hydrogenase assembly HybE family chaperone